MEPDALQVITGDRVPRDATNRQGLIAGACWGSMGDWPMFDFLDSDGTTWKLTREGDPRRYVPGLRAEIAFVPGGSVARIALERSGRRVSGLAIGPGGAGLRGVGRAGTIVHWAVLDHARPDALVQDRLARSGALRCRRADAGLLQIVGGDYDEIRAAVKELGGVYDGHEVLASTGLPMVFGPTGESA